ncbi:hypothetical protein IL306_015274 [Fusarium sp. DS 682]|nr:hypothetical protein IL306_015274 [Fusarium sp. DS 682]
MANLEEAEKIVKEVTGYYGYLDHDMMDDIGRFNSDYRRRIDENWLKMENAASHSIKVLAKNIYGSGARFVFELLQNAEDNSFREANAKNDPPFISFQIHPKHIVVECNEDGFNRPDLKAICSVGESTKTAAHGYVGAKGIGFKSVFIAASRVHIQSGYFSFEFRHNRNDPGLGMVRPIWVKPREAVPSPLTRTTLYLHDQGDEDEIQHLKTVIAMQFDDLQETCLLFLRKLRKISVAFFDEEGNLERSKQFTKQKIDDYRVSLETTTVSDGEEDTKSQIYHITKKLATGLAQSESRDPATTDEARRILTSAEVVLAFPLQSDYKPYISRKKQELFAFLPLRTSDYKFHIQSDFDTNANRQDIVTTTRRNLNIREWIAQTFLQAILEFNEHPILCYSWPLFLPSQETGHDSFWSGLDAKIMSLIRNNPILRSRNRTDLRCINDVLIASNGMKGDGGKLLLDDPIQDPFISAKYLPKAIDQLKLYGLQVAPVSLFVTLLQKDLNQPGSKMRADTTGDDWHSPVARMCSNICENGWNGTRLLKSLEILPLRRMEWTSSTSGPIYFPMTGDIEIPKGLDLKVIRALATTNPDRRNLFRNLGVTEATAEEVRSAIFASFTHQSNIYILDCLCYLFLTHSNFTHKRADYKSSIVFTEDLHLYRTHDSVVYLPGKDHPFSPGSLLEGADVPPDFPVRFVRSGYLLVPQDYPRISLSPWKRWLCDYVGLHERLRILSPNGAELSQPFQYVFNHRPDKFIGLFEYLWLLDGKELLKHPSIVSQIKQLSAKELCKVEFSPKIQETWLPFPQLKDSVRRYMENPEQFPFLILDNDRATEPIGTKWDFLSKHFGVGKDDDLEFLLEMLHCIKRSLEDIVSELECRKDDPIEEGDDHEILDLYKYLHEELTVTSDKRAAFEKSPLIFVRQPNGPGWYKTSECLWSSTTPIRGKVTLDESYEDLKALFVGKLGVKSLTMQMVYDELRQSPQSSPEDIKVALLSFNDFLQTENGHWDPEPIRNARVFPVLYPDGTVRLSSIDVDFAIGDRDNLRSKFADRISLLDFDLEDVHRLRPLFRWLKIQDRYLSKSVMESTAISGEQGSPISSTKRDLGLKAYHICR